MGSGISSVSYTHLRFPWEKVHIFWVDERCVPPTDVASNYKLADDFLIHPAHIPGRNVHRILGELLPATAAKRYVGEVRDFFGLEAVSYTHLDVYKRQVESTVPRVPVTERNSCSVIS